MKSLRDTYPWVGYLPTHVVVNLATLGPVGRVKRAPGTAGAFVGLLLATAFVLPLPPIAYLLSLLALTYFAIAICDEAEQRLGKRDPGEIVLDEAVAMPLCFIGLNPMLAELQAQHLAWIAYLIGFALFRFFDIFKPLGIRRLQHLPGGIGVVVDDHAAALATAICLHMLAAFL